MIHRDLTGLNICIYRRHHILTTERPPHRVIHVCQGAEQQHHGSTFCASKISTSTTAVGILHVSTRGSSDLEFQVSEMNLDSNTPPTKWKQIWMTLIYVKKMEKPQRMPMTSHRMQKSPNMIKIRLLSSSSCLSADEAESSRPISTLLLYVRMSSMSASMCPAVDTKRAHST
mmetsp:Transcript_22345/g.37851  ORF Transcript_22345/g.37851 Transcript_22345/m.37851 type:complete len:172 (+) Transcript_22345:3424-3939(+)